MWIKYTDCVQAQPDWKDAVDYEAPSMVCYACGYLVHVNKDSYVVAVTVSGDSGYASFTSEYTIPKAVILDIRELSL